MSHGDGMSTTNAGTAPDGDRRRDLAARAAWLYYVAGATQDVIAEKLKVSRAGAQRLVALAMAERLVTVRLDHPIAACMELARALADRFALAACDVAPAAPDDGAVTRRAIAILAAERLERELAMRAPVIVGVGSGRTMRAIVDELPALAQPQHRIVGLVGAIARDGSANPFEVVMRLADRIGAQRFPLPLPTITETAAERELWQAQLGYGRIRALAERAQLSLVGIGQIAWEGPLYVDGFITDAELAELMRRGAVGEILGWTFDATGRLLEGSVNDRVTSIPLQPTAERRIVAAAGGPAKVEAILGALRGRLVDGLLTDEATAAALLARA
jgi:DNA-binding transcriptional regulator LsrR (DeoR family)